MKRGRFSGFNFFIVEMLAAMKRVKDYTHGLGFEEFTTNDLIRDAVVRNFEVIGESARHIPFNFQKKHHRIPWNHMVSLRNFIAHEFFDVDDDILWAIIKTDMDQNIADLEMLIREL